MSRPTESQEAVNADSFLDIVASVVSIMLIMVMMIGMRIRNTSVDDLVSAGVEEVQGELQQALSKEEAIRDDVLQAAEQIKAIERESVVKAAQREVLGVTIAALEHNLRTRREQLSTGDQQNYDLVRNVTLAKQQLGEFERQRQAIDNLEPPPQEIKCLPTPISQKVDGPERFFLLSHGRIVYVPHERLLSAAADDARRKRLGPDDEVHGDAGPISGFRIKYAARLNRSGPHGIPTTDVRCEIFATSELLGETVADALSPTSGFRSDLAECRPGRETITLWVHANSFDVARHVREELYRLKFAVAVWPLPDGMPIGIGSDGEKSAAQ